MLKIYPVETNEDLDIIKTLFKEFADVLKTYFAEYSERPSFKEYFESYEHEIAHLLPGDYGRPNGCLLLALYQEQPAGCVGLKDIGSRICEMKRLFVRPQYRRLGIGKALAEAVIEQGRSIGYTSMRVNTNRKMLEAIGLYKSFGFKEIPPYEHFTVEDLGFMELKLV